MAVPFQDFDTKNIQGNIIFLDLDGTVIEDGGAEIEPLVAGKIDELKKDNTVYLCTNKKGMAERNKKIALFTGIKWIDTPCRKPSQKILNYISNEAESPYLVIGDKHLTDGWFARRIGAEFIKVKRITSAGDGLAEKAVYLFDDAVGRGVVGIFETIIIITGILRPLQWIKNFLVFVPIFFAGEFFMAMKFVPALLTFVTFCLAASGVYIINDICDRKNDQKHPVKRNRAIASGRLTVAQAIAVLAILAGLAGTLLYVKIPLATAPVAVYFLMNIAYSLYLKNLPVFDILAVSLFYLLRILAGGMATATYISRWLILCTIFITLFIIIGKRKAEFNNSNVREVLKKYNATLFDHLLTVSVAATLVVYGIYTVLGVASDKAVYSIFFVLVGMFRYLFLIYTSAEAEFPERAVYRDKVVLASVIGWIVYMLYIFYV